MKLDLFTNATVVDDAIGFVAGKFKDKAKSSSTNDNKNEKEESNEPDYDEDKDQLEEEQEEKLERDDIINDESDFLNRFAFLPFKYTQKKLNLAKIKEVAIEEEIKEGI